MSITMHRACNKGYGTTPTMRSTLGFNRAPRVDLNAFLVVCFLWRADRKASPTPKPQPGALASVL